ncbi:hypothetical protein HOF40_00600 [Candidatus Parcubacteria bacterium]|jgi:riboflavin kinase / FMN adenylyltransferase|nr:hypothetical protein [Candidatus Parcubacteria bacterium]MBT3948569.1 hypothetical protein [Candidatus Parcubacteria bacterium]
MIGGIVIKGDGLGHKYGYPTANLDCLKRDIKISGGVYAAWGFFDNKKYKAALVIQEKPWKVEVYLIGLDEDIYGRHVEVEVVQKVSELEKFDTKDEVIKKIHSDMKMIEEMLEK